MAEVHRQEDERKKVKKEEKETKRKEEEDERERLGVDHEDDHPIRFNTETERQEVKHEQEFKEFNDKHFYL